MDRRCALRVPWPRWAVEEGLTNGDKDWQNWQELERWAYHLFSCIEDPMFASGADRQIPTVRLAGTLTAKSEHCIVGLTAVGFQGTEKVSLSAAHLTATNPVEITVSNITTDTHLLTHAVTACNVTNTIHMRDEIVVGWTDVLRVDIWGDPTTLWEFVLCVQPTSVHNPRPDEPIKIHNDEIQR